MFSAPEAGHPLPAVLDLLPVAADPAPADRGFPPKTAHPDVALRAVIPRPVTGDPNDIVAFGANVRRRLRNGGRRLLALHRGRDGLGFDRFRIGLVDRTAGEHFDARRRRVVLAGRGGVGHEPAGQPAQAGS